MPALKGQPAPSLHRGLAGMLLLLAGLLHVLPASAQNAASTPALDPSEQVDPTLTTLHVYTTHLQTVSLAAGNDGRLLAVHPEDFRLRLDHGKPFAPSAIHLAAEDPITLFVVLDLSNPGADLKPALAQAVGSLRQGPLTSQDRVEVYAFDCTTFRSNLPTDTAAHLTDAVDVLLREPRLHNTKHPGHTCADSLHVWDAAGVALNRLKDQPGRRVLLLVSNGGDQESRLTADQIRLYANNAATAVFALPASRPGPNRNEADALQFITANAGGMLLEPPSHDPALALAQFISLLRQRYVLEFPRPYSLSGGSHDLAVELRGSKARIRTTGTSTPLTSRDRRGDADTISDDGAVGGALTAKSAAGNQAAPSASAAPR